MEEKICKNCGKIMDIDDSYDTCENCRTKDAETKRNILAIGTVATFLLYKFLKKIINKK